MQPYCKVQKVYVKCIVKNEELSNIGNTTKEIQNI
jgi:hypothetical protein